MSQTPEEYDEENLEGFTPAEYLKLIRLSNWFDDPRTAKSFKSKEAICKSFEGVGNPSPMIKRVVTKMEMNRFLKYNAEGRLEFAEDVFDKWVEFNSNNGKAMWTYFERHVLPYFRSK